MIEKLILPDHLTDSLTDHAKNVLDNQKLFIQSFKDTKPYNSSTPIDIENDSIIPGLSDEFIINWDKTQLRWGDHNLQHNCCANLHKIALPKYEITVELLEYLESLVGSELIQPSGNFLYPANGFMGWHTNSDMPGIRVYMAFTTEEKSSYFKYYDYGTNSVIYDWDNAGWTIRKFVVENNPSKYFWHSVRCTTAPRISYGFWFK